MSDALHTAICQAVGILNMAPELARHAEGRQVRDILRQALIDYVGFNAAPKMRELQNTAATGCIGLPQPRRHPPHQEQTNADAVVSARV